MTSHPIEIE